MMITWRHRLLHQKEEDMEQIDVHGLPEEEVRLIADFVEFLRLRRQDRLPPTAAAPAEQEPLFAAWPLGVKGILSREEIYAHR